MKDRPKIKDLIDGHAHLSDMDDPGKAIEKARSVGISQVVAVAMNLTSCIKVLDLADQYPDVVLPGLGYHPWEINAWEVDPTLNFIDQNLSQAVALGEVGLDYKIKVKKKLQKEVFAQILNLGKKHQKPVIIHSRFSHGRTHEMTKTAGIQKAVFHWYSGPLDILGKILDDGFHVSATPALKYSTVHRKAMEKAPIERILIETDSPVKYQGRKSEPAMLHDTLLYLSQIKGLSIKETAEITTDNARRFFELNLIKTEIYALRMGSKSSMASGLIILSFWATLGSNKT